MVVGGIQRVHAFKCQGHRRSYIDRDHLLIRRKLAWFSEILPFPNAVLAHRYPNVPNLGDMTRLLDNKLNWTR